MKRNSLLSVKKSFVKIEMRSHQVLRGCVNDHESLLQLHCFFSVLIMNSQAGKSNVDYYSIASTKLQEKSICTRHT